MACAILISAGGRVEQHVAPLATDLLMAAQQALPQVAGAFRGADRGHVPGLDVQLDPVQAGDCPGEAGQCDERRRGDAPPSGAGSHAVARRCPPVAQFGQPEADVPTARSVSASAIANVSPWR